MLDTSPLLHDLTPAQREAVAHVDGPLLVLAGPGSGKTRVITRRVAYLVGQGIPAWSILAVTFTNKAAGEMRDRIDALLPPDLPGRRGLTVSTFHALCARLLRRYAAEAGLDPGFVIYDTTDQRDAIKRAVVDAGLDSAQFSPGNVAATISKAKNALLDAAAFAAEATDFSARMMARVYTAYERVLAANRAVDFDDLLLRTARLLRSRCDVLAQLQERYRYLLIDEYQDTNHAQFLIANAIAGPPSTGSNICVVGDPDQSIYGWRGADLRNILEFEEHHPQARVIPLGENFRSTGHIVEASAALIACNVRRKEKELFTSLEAGEPVSAIVCQDEVHEAEQVVERFRALEESGVPYREMAVLYRMNALSRVIEAALRDAQVPYVVARGTAFYDRKEIRDALACLRLLLNPADEIALQRVVSTPPRGIGATTMEKLRLHAVHTQVTLFEAMRVAGTIDSLGARARKAIAEFVGLIEGLRAEAFETSWSAGPSDLAAYVARVIRASGLEAHHAKDASDEGVDRIANLGELVSAAATFRLPDADDDPLGQDEEQPGSAPLRLDGLLAAFLESVALVSDADAIDPERGAVTLMTLHAAKGLEYDAVAIIGLEQGTLPHQRGLESDHELEEERRLCYVGMTRARRHLLMTRTEVRTVRGMTERRIPSQFLSELPAGAVRMSGRAAGGFGRDGST
ncbi:MAG: UvrD-helicase domain-containing protein, partial [Phycisphaerales bacterium]|nr:UvrD-helicase domain-containing protein [Phycisphaerales bacterium]